MYQIAESISQKGLTGYFWQKAKQRRERAIALMHKVGIREHTKILDSYPHELQGLDTGVLAIATGWRHTCAQMASGGVKCWGYNHRGQLGDGSRKYHSNTPTDVFRFGD